MKKGIALLITIGFIAVLVALIAYVFSISQEVFDEARELESQNQNAIFYKDGKDIVDRYVGDVKESEDFERFLDKLSLFVYETDNSSLHVEIEPLNNKININSLLIDKKIDENIVVFLENICTRYNVLDAQFFIDLLLDTIDTDELSRQTLSEISLSDKKFSNSRIINFSHFETILRYYVDTVLDTNILQIPWDEYIFFGKIQKDILDCDRMSVNLVEVLGFDKDTYTDCSSLKQSDTTQIITKYRLKEFSKENHYYILVKIHSKIGLSETKMAFIYDLKTKKVSDIELF